MERAATGAPSSTPSLDRIEHSPAFPAVSPAGLEEEAREAGRLLAALPIVHLRVEARAEGTLDAPFAGSLIRGGLGAALYRLACKRPSRPCAGCDLLAACRFPPLFGPIDGPAVDGPAPPSRDASPLRGSAARLFALVPPPLITPAGLVVELKLFGPPDEAVRLVLESILEMGRAGIGRERVRLEIDRIDCLGPGGCSAGELAASGRLLRPEGALAFAASDLGPPAPAGREREGAGASAAVALELLTPLRMKEAGRIESGLAPERLLRSALRRLTDLGLALGQAWPRAWPGILAAARGVEVLEERLRWVEHGRYSLRQARAMRLGGFTGRIEYAGVPRVLLPLLRAAAFAQLGKNVTFGLGVARLEVAA